MTRTVAFGYSTADARLFHIPMVVKCPRGGIAGSQKRCQSSVSSLVTHVEVQECVQRREERGAVIQPHRVIILPESRNSR